MSHMTIIFKLMFSFYFLKFVKTNPIYSLNIIFYFILFLKIISRE